MKHFSWLPQKSGLIIAMGSLLLFSFSNTSREPAANVTVTLMVDTDAVNKDNTDETCSFMGQPEGVSNKAFTIEVNVGDVVTWVGASTSSDDDVVEIIQINYQGGKNVFGSNALNGKDGVVQGQIVNSTVGAADCKYNIKFRVKGKNGVFQIDPVIKSH